MYQGDITKANVDVIVNSTNPQFDLTRGNIQATTLCTYRIQIIVFQHRDFTFHHMKFVKDVHIYRCIV